MVVQPIGQLGPSALPNVAGKSARYSVTVDTTFLGPWSGGLKSLPLELSVMLLVSLFIYFLNNPPSVMVLSSWIWLL